MPNILPIILVQIYALSAKYNLRDSSSNQEIG
jgi:hypothetical protein